MAKKRTAVAETPLDGQPADQPAETPVLEQPPADAPVQTDTQPAKAEDLPPEPINGTRPVESFSVPCGGGAYIQVSVWSKKIEYDGKEIVVYSASVRKCYKDATTGEWKNMHSFRGSELYCVQHVLTCASNWILNARTTTSSDCPF